MLKLISFRCTDEILALQLPCIAFKRHANGASAIVSAFESRKGGSKT